VNVHRQSHLLASCLEANELGVAVAGGSLTLVVFAVLILVSTLTNPTLRSSVHRFTAIVSSKSLFKSTPAPPVRVTSGSRASTLPP
jgi:hypothetical protein